MRGLSIGAEKKQEGVELNMSPLIDMVFILLIFFLVTASFVKDSGGPVINRPIATTAEDKEKTNMIVSVTKDGEVWIEGKAVDIRSVRTQIEKFAAENPQGSIVMKADADSEFGVPNEVLQKIREGGIANVTVAASKE